MSAQPLFDDLRGVTRSVTIKVEDARPSAAFAKRRLGTDWAPHLSEADMNGKSRRGFASMDPEKQREIASKGGKAAHAQGTAHEFTVEEARKAGRMGGCLVSKDRAHMAAIGHMGGQARKRSRAHGEDETERGRG